MERVFLERTLFEFPPISSIQRNRGEIDILFAGMESQLSTTFSISRQVFRIGNSKSRSNGAQLNSFAEKELAPAQIIVFHKIVKCAPILLYNLYARHDESSKKGETFLLQMLL